MELEIIKHRDILFKDILRAVAIKSVAWPYPCESQLKWVIDNISDSDEHVFLKDGGVDKAYMNLVKTTFIANDTEYMAYGIGNVCSVEKGKGYGRELMLQVNKYLEQKLHAGFLFCKAQLVPFYTKFGWDEVMCDRCDVMSLPDDVHIMTYLLPEPTISFQYKGKLF